MNAGNWNAERVERLRALWRAGHTFGQIRDQLGPGLFSRNAIIGKAHRLGLADSQRRASAPAVRPRRTGPQGEGAPPRARAAKVRAAGHPWVPKTQWKPSPVALPPAATPKQLGIAGPGAVGLAALRAHHCRWPVGEVDGADQLFCGARPDGSAYCAAHHAAAIRPDQGSAQRDLDRWAKRFG